MPPVVGDAADADGGQPPAIIIIDLGDGHLELVAQAGQHGFQHLPLSLEGHVFREAQADPGDTHFHLNKKPVRRQNWEPDIPNLSSAQESVKQITTNLFRGNRR